jgi:DNA-binding NarL/FixJ family response regulator
MKEIKVFLVDDQEIFREGLARLLKERPNIRLVSQCGNNEPLAKQIEASKPDILLIDTIDRKSVV